MFKILRKVCFVVFMAYWSNLLTGFWRCYYANTIYDYAEAWPEYFFEWNWKE